MTKSEEILKNWDLNYGQIVSTTENGNSAFYNTDLNSCRNIYTRIIKLPSWEPSTWIPGSNKDSNKGQTRNKVLSGGVYLLLEV